MAESLGGRSRSLRSEGIQRLMDWKQNWHGLIRFSATDHRARGTPSFEVSLLPRD
jgi:hypothetical protein